jgi:hypothetical protein
VALGHSIFWRRFPQTSPTILEVFSSKPIRSRATSRHGPLQGSILQWGCQWRKPHAEMWALSGYLFLQQSQLNCSHPPNLTITFSEHVLLQSPILGTLI